MDPYRSSVDRAVKAWQSTAETYAQVFQSLAKATAASAWGEKDQSHDHSMFEEMARTAREALDASKSFTLFEDRPEFANHVGVADEEDTGESEGDHYDVPEQSNRDRRAKMGDNRRHRREKKLHKRAARLAIEVVERAKAQAEFEHNTAPVVEFEDVSAEVEARLRAKDEQKATATKQKKRKRGSIDSVELMVVDGNIGPLDVKKPKLDDTTSDSEYGLELRRKHLRDADENVEGEFHKRRKQSKM